jgi:hypothetical protein
MRTVLASSLVLAMALTPMFDTSAMPASRARQQPDNSQQPQYTPQDNSPQQQPDNSQQQYDPNQQNNAPQDNSQNADTTGYQSFTADQLDNLLSPIALYPDPLLAQVFVASTFPDQVEAAAQYVRGGGTQGVDDQDWDVSVRAVAHYPSVIEMMADKIDWTTSLGQAYVNQSTDVATSVQRLRHLAKNVGNLQTNTQQEVLENDNYIAINPVQPQYIYVPTYDPAIIYYRRPYWGPAITFGIGYPIGGWLNLGFRWGFWGGGFGGVYYTGWNPYGWGRGCWNCGWIGRSRGYVNYRNNVYINNRYTNININRTVINRRVNVNNMNRYNYVHKNVNYNNVARNNSRPNRGQFQAGGRPDNNNGRPGNGNVRPGDNNRPGNNGRPGDNNRPGSNGRPGDNNAGFRPGQNNNGNRPGQNNGRPSTLPANGGNRPGQTPRPGNIPGRTDRPPANNKMLDRNINNANRANDFRGRESNGTARPVTERPQQQSRSQQSTPHTFGRSEGNFNVRQSQQRGQQSRQQARPAPQQRSAPQRSAPQQHSAPRGGGGRRP